MFLCPFLNTLSHITKNNDEIEVAEHNLSVIDRKQRG